MVIFYNFSKGGRYLIVSEVLSWKGFWKVLTLNINILDCILTSNKSSFGINTGRLLTSTVTSPYIAIQDCYVNIYSSVNVGSINIDGVNIFLGQAGNWMTYIIPLAKGQTLTFGDSNQVSTMHVYAAK